jgi:hypothetical protein
MYTIAVASEVKDRAETFHAGTTTEAEELLRSLGVVDGVVLTGVGYYPLVNGDIVTVERTDLRIER